MSPALISGRTQPFSAWTTEVADLTDRDLLVEQVRRTRPDLVLLDLDIGGAIGNGVSLVALFRSAGVRVLVVSGSNDAAWKGAALEQGALAVLDKRAVFGDLLDSILRAARGESVMPDQERHRMLGEMRRQRLQNEPFERLTDREKRVLHGLARGETVTNMAEEWVVSEATIRSQVRGVLIKLGVNSQLEAVAHAHRSGWLKGRGARRTA